jgi:cation transport regulator ChaC
MKFLLALLLSVKLFSSPWNDLYQDFLLEHYEDQKNKLKEFPLLNYPNHDFEKIIPQGGKILIFGYGSLMSKESLGGTNNTRRKATVKPTALATMRPVIAFGLKRLFDYDYKNLLPHKERAFLNVEPSENRIINGVVFEVDHEDLAALVDRETGYDLIPILVASWEAASKQKEEIEFEVAYTFMASEEPRDGIVYKNKDILPIPRYQKAVMEAASSYGRDFYEFFCETTFLSDGINH